MRKRIIALLLFVCFHCNVKAQINLVPNYSFEIDSLCPNNAGQIDYSVPWYNPTWGSPDYFNSCDGSAINSYGVPQSWIGNQNARTGNAYAGLFGYIGQSGDPNEGKEYIQVKLVDSLIEQKQYCIGFYVNFAKSPLGALTYNNVAITEIGMYVSDTAISSSNLFYLPFIPQIQSPDSVYLNDTVNWVEISGTYMAHGGEKYITIGNFNAHTDTIGVVNHNNYSASYYFIDDVSVIDCDSLIVGEDKLGNKNNELEIYPNPSTAQFTIHSEGTKINQLKITNIVGQEILILHKEEQNDKSVTVDLTGVSNGIYFVEIKTEKGVVNRKIVKQ